jgi:hypothetical protein
MKTIGEILEKNTALEKLVRKTHTSKNLAFIFRSMLDAGFAKHCHFAHLKDSVLTITVTNAAWATRLRYAIPDMVKNLSTQPEFKQVTTIRYSVTQQNGTVKIKEKQTKLSRTNEILWQETMTDLKRNTKQKKSML